MDTPSQVLAKRIVDRLLKEGLISEAEAKRLPAKISDGKQRPEDWRLSIELNETKEVKP